jgi:hypothetical protein
MMDGSRQATPRLDRRHLRDPRDRRRFAEYSDTNTTSRRGVEVAQLAMQQRVFWARFVYTAARESRHVLAGMLVRVAAPQAPPTVEMGSRLTLGRLLRIIVLCP